MDIRKIDYLYQREFDTSETVKVLTHNKTIYWSWGVSKYVLITLSWDDTYKVDYLNRNLKVIDTQENIYFDQLVEFIDNRIERIGEYVV